MKSEVQAFFRVATFHTIKQSHQETPSVFLIPPAQADAAVDFTILIYFRKTVLCVKIPVIVNHKTISGPHRVNSKTAS
jgi:hypothetical protein